MPGPESEPTVETRTIYEGRIVNLRVDTVRLPNGRLTTREIAEHSPTVCVVAVDQDGQTLLVRQYRKPTESHLLEIPAGGIEAGEDPEDAVRRELQEETGFNADSLQHLSSFWLAPGWCTEYMHAYLATGLSPAAPCHTADDDENIKLERVPLEETLGLIERGEIQDSKSIASLLLALRRSPRQGND